MARTVDLDSLLLAGMIREAQRLALLLVVEALQRGVGFRDPAGLTVVGRFAARKSAELERLFLGLKDIDPRLAARLHGRYEAIMGLFAGA